MDKDIGSEIRRIRRDHRLTQKQVAEKLGVTEQMIGQWENGSRSPKAETLKQLIRAIIADREVEKADQGYIKTLLRESLADMRCALKLLEEAGMGMVRAHNTGFVEADNFFGRLGGIQDALESLINETIVRKNETYRSWKGEN